MTISENGVMTTDSDDIDILIVKPLDILIAKPLKEYLADQSGSVDNGKVQKEFAKIQKSLKSHGIMLRVLMTSTTMRESHTIISL